jgi:mannose-1-phosphate guanylyltransferase
MVKKAILLAAGFGTRLKPLTNSIPKCLVPINGKPLLEIWLDNLSQAGIETFLVNTHYLRDIVAGFVERSKYKDRILIVNETVLLGTAGTLRENISFTDGSTDVLLIHADNYCITDFGAFFRAHEERPSNCEMTMMCFKTDQPQQCGIIELNSKNIVIGFHEKVQNPPGNLANGAVYLLSRSILNYIYKSSFCDFSTEVIPRYLGRIYCYENTGRHIDVGTPEAYAKANLPISPK